MRVGYYASPQPSCNASMIGHSGTSLPELAANDRSFLEWVLRKDFSDEVKAIVQDALAGRFPVRGEAESG